MSTIFGSRPQSQTVNEYTSVAVQTSSQGAAIPLVYGMNRIGTNLIWEANFTNYPASGKGSQGGKGGGGGKSGGGGSYTYSAALGLGLCEGEIAGVGTVWANSDITTLGSLNLTLFSGTQTQSAPAYIVSNYPSEALSYAETAWLFSSLYNLGSSPSVPQHNFEVQGIFYGGASTNAWNAGSPDVNMGLVIPDYITNPQYGLDPTATYIDSVSLATYSAYLDAQGIWMSPALDTQEQATQAIQRWAQLTNSWIFWNGTQLVFVPLGTETIIANGATYTPNLVPVYALSTANGDFIFDSDNEPPVTVTRIDPADGYNNVQLDTRDRANQYNDNPLRYDDQTSEDQYGVLQSQVVQADEICDANVGQLVAFLIGARSVYIRNSYEWKAGYGYVLLQPGDIVTLTDPGIGLSDQPVRITEVGEDDKQVLKFTAEECPAAVGIAVLYTPQANAAGPTPNLSVDPGSVNTPAIFEPSPIFTNGQAEVWIGASGGVNWGGCQVYISSDGTNYARVGAITGPSAQGTLTGTLALASGLDTTNTLSIDLSESATTLSTNVTDANAQAFQTASLVDTEIVAYGTVTVTGAETFDLTYLERGVYGTAPAAHAVGAPFTRINPGVSFQYDLPAQYVGVTLYFKFPSFNQFGGATQSIADAVEYSYTPAGVAFTIAAPTGIALAASRTTQADGTTVLAMTASWTASAGPLLGSYEVQLSANGGSTWTVDTTVGSGATSYVLAPALASTSYSARVRAISQSGLAVSAWDTLGTAVNSGTLVTSVPATPSGLSATAISGGFALNWTASTDPSILSYQVWVASGSSQPFTSASLVQTVSAPATTVTVLGEPASALSVYLVAVNAAGSSLPAG